MRQRAHPLAAHIDPSVAVPGVGIAALSVLLEAGAAPKAFRLLPLGTFRAVDGRPEGVSAWRLSADDAERIAADIAASQRDLPIDYEHQILNAADNGQPAPAAGWIRRVALRTDGDAPGLWAEDVLWTERARQMIEGVEYRYISPVFTWEKRSGRVQRLLMAALTNHPALDGLADLQPLKEDHMADQQALAALTAALGEIGDADPVAAATARIAEQTTEIERLRARVGELEAAVAAGGVPIAEHARLQAELAALGARLDADERNRLLEAGLADGRILPAQRAFWAEQPLAALKNWLAVAQPLAALVAQQSAGRVARNAGTSGLSDEQAELCRVAGWKPEVFGAGNPARA